MQSKNVADNKIPKPSSFGIVLLTARPDVEVVGVVEAIPYTACFLSPKHIGILSLLLSDSINRALNTFCYSTIALYLAHS